MGCTGPKAQIDGVFFLIKKTQQGGLELLGSCSFHSLDGPPRLPWVRMLNCRIILE